MLNATSTVDSSFHDEDKEDAIGYRVLSTSTISFHDTRR